jgi:hypothetical protein
MSPAVTSVTLRSDVEFLFGSGCPAALEAANVRLGGHLAEFPKGHRPGDGQPYAFCFGVRRGRLPTIRTLNDLGAPFVSFDKG